eukprot:6199801-Pleurochrysis_carterae.AAC.2
MPAMLIRGLSLGPCTRKHTHSRLILRTTAEKACDMYEGRIEDRRSTHASCDRDARGPLPAPPHV